MDRIKQIAFCNTSSCLSPIGINDMRTKLLIYI